MSPYRISRRGLGALALLGSAAACAPRAADEIDADGPLTLSLAHVHTEDESAQYHHFATRFAEKVAEHTGGDVAIDIAGNGRYGNERVVVEGLQIGTVDCTIVGSFILAGFAQEFQIFDLPFLFTDYSEARDALVEEVTSPFDALLGQRHIVPLAWSNGGFRNLLSAEVPVRGPEDLHRLKIRLPESRTYIDAFSAMGAKPIPMAFSELIPALQQGTIDAIENPTQAIYDQQYYEVASHLSETRHFFSPALLLLSEHAAARLEDSQLEGLRRAASEASAAHWDFVVDGEERYSGLLLETGLEIIRDVDVDGLRGAARSTYDAAQEIHDPELLDAVLDRTGVRR